MHVWLTTSQWSVSYQTQVKKQIFQKHVDGGRKRTHRSKTFYTFSMTSAENPPSNNYSNEISFYFWRLVVYKSAYDFSFSACDMEQYLVVVSVVGSCGGVVVLGFMWKIHCMLKFERFQADCDQSLNVRYVVEMDFSCFSQIFRHLFPCSQYAACLSVWLHVCVCVVVGTPYGHLCP